MGNCQAAEAATVVIQRPGGAVERIYWSVSANEVMASNPGHYVAVVTVSSRSENGVPVKQLKLLRPDDTLHIGHVYRLISFEEVLKEFAGKKYTKLSRVLSMQKQREIEKSKQQGRRISNSNSNKTEVEDMSRVGGGGSSSRSGGMSKQRQWKPALQSIAEVGS
ncbi:DUF4228 domain-containing protein [Cinnamomum micranthum f. kanehirae]|uniref:DUF4228 domain-containing protein n=1 Tax=Cinnamomum micranthum f. kanehirae TaxID=337451 RepID=A0A443NVD8_9MAGN|nr:DUF4228 domain-containing protein [Cinnamomum micranthum f. kanehirae]